MDRNYDVTSKTPIEESFQVEMESGEMTSNEWNKHIAEEMLNEIKRVINFKLIPTLLEKNLIDLELAPTIEFSEIGDLDLTNLMLFIQSADKSGLVPPTLEMCNAILKRLLGNDTPTITQEEFDNYQRRREVNTWAYGSEKLAEETANTAVEPDNSEPIDGGSENNDGDNK